MRASCRPSSRTLLALALLAVPALPAFARPSVPHETVILRALDKVTARTHEIEVRVDEVHVFGRIEITPRACLTSPPLDTPEATSFLEIRELEHDGSKPVVFQGWMFASSPGLSAMEHPVYDVWVLGCADPSA